MIKNLLTVVIGLLVIGILYVAVVPFLPQMGTQDGLVACTQEAMLCPDGTYVGRQGPNCEFAPCPTIE